MNITKLLLIFFIHIKYLNILFFSKTFIADYFIKVLHRIFSFAFYSVYHFGLRVSVEHGFTFLLVILFLWTLMHIHFFFWYKIIFKSTLPLTWIHCLWNSKWHIIKLFRFIFQLRMWLWKLFCLFIVRFFFFLFWFLFVITVQGWNIRNFIFTFFIAYFFKFILENFRALLISWTFLFKF